MFIKNNKILFFNIPFVKSELPKNNSKYIYWPLHMRPESSELTLGIGLDELTLIKKPQSL